MRFKKIKIAPPYVFIPGEIIFRKECLERFLVNYYSTKQLLQELCPYPSLLLHRTSYACVLKTARRL